MPITRRPARKESKAKPVARRLSNSDLLKLAAKRKPPQAWYDEQADPTRPDVSNGRGK